MSTQKAWAQQREQQYNEKTTLWNGKKYLWTVCLISVWWSLSPLWASLLHMKKPSLSKVISKVQLSSNIQRCDSKTLLLGKAGQCGCAHGNREPFLWFLRGEWNLRKLAFPPDFSQKGKKVRLGIDSGSVHTLALCGLNFRCTRVQMGQKWMELAELIAIFFITVQCLISAMTPADDNRSPGLTRSRLFLIWSFFVCISGDWRFLILKSQTAWTVSSTVSLACYL